VADSYLMKLFIKARDKVGGISALQRELLRVGVQAVSTQALYLINNRIEEGEKIDRMRLDLLAGLLKISGDTDSELARDLIRTYLKH
jgi:hypothetical protein